MKIKFNEHGVTGRKSGVCPKCGNRASRQIRIYQTYNPFNKDNDGNVKSAGQILDECCDDLLSWKREPVYHAKCEL